MSCPNCGTVLFLRDINFNGYEDDGNARTYWKWHPENGWMHRDQIMCRVEGLERFPEIETPTPNNSATPESVARRGGRSVKSLVGKR